MAVYALIDDTKPAHHARATAQPTPLGTGPCQYVSATPVADGMPALAAVLDTRYKAGGSTTWERPAATGTP